MVELEHHAREMRAQPRHAAELQRVRDLVQRDPAQELVGLRVERADGVAEVGRDEEQPRGRLRVEHRELVLAEHAAGEEARDRAGLDRQHGAGGAPDDAAQRAHALGRLGGGGVEHPAHRAQVRVDPGGAVDRLGDGQHARGGLQPRVGRDELLGLVGRAHERLERSRIPGGLQRRDALRHLRCELPVDHGSMVAGALSDRLRGARAPARRGRPADRAATTGETGSITDNGAPRGSAQAVNATAPPPSRTISCAAATSTERQRRSVTMPSSRPAATWQSETAIAPSARRRCAVAASASAASRTQAGSAGLDPEQLELAADAPLRGARIQPRAVQQGALAAPRDPLLVRPEVVHEAEHDVGHRVALRDGQREREMRQAALGVARPVERVDHDEHRIARVEAEVDAAALLADGREPGAVRMEPLQPPEHGRLGSGVDLERAVAALPARARLTRALRGGRRGGEHAAQLLGGSARGGRPIRCEGAHPPYPTKVPVIEESTVQLEAITHPGGPLLILAAAGTGKTHTLIERFAWLVEQGTPADAILALTFSDHRGRRPARAHRAARAGALRGAVDHDVPRVLRAPAPRRGARGRRRPVRGARDALGPARDAARADRRAPARLARPARQPERAARLDRAADRPAQGRARHRARLRGLVRQAAGGDRDRPGAGGARARVRRDLRRPRPHARRGGHARLRRPRRAGVRAAAVQAARPRAARRPLPPRAGRRVPGHELRPGPAAAAAGRRARQRHRGRRRRPVDPPLPRGVDEERRRLPRRVAGRRRRAPERELPRGRAHHRRRPGGRRAGPGAPAEAARGPSGRARGRGRVLALRVRARAGAGGGGRRRAARRARGRRPRGRVRARALGQGRGAGGRRGARGARRALPPRGRGGLLPARRGARPARLAAAAGRPRRCRRRRARAGAAAGRAARDRPRALHPDRAPAQARHGRRARRGAGVAADPARGARAHPRLPQALPVGRRRAGLDAPRSLRAPPDRAARPAPPAAVRRVDGGGRAAGQPGQVRPARRRLPAPLPAGDRARVRPLDRGGRRRRAARGGGRRQRSPARRPGDGDARRQGARVRSRLRARPDGRAHAGPAPARARADPGRADQGGAAAGLQGRSTWARCGA